MEAPGEMAFSAKEGDYFGMYCLRCTISRSQTGKHWLWVARISPVCASLAFSIDMSDVSRVEKALLIAWPNSTNIRNDFAKFPASAESSDVCGQRAKIGRHIPHRSKINSHSQSYCTVLYTFWVKFSPFQWMEAPSACQRIAVCVCWKKCEFIFVCKIYCSYLSASVSHAGLRLRGANDWWMIKILNHAHDSFQF